MTVEKRHPLLKRLFTALRPGVAPPSGGGTANFLRADGTWAAPPGSGGSVTSVGVSSSGAESAALTVAGSPVTGSGVITLTPNLFGSGAPGVVPSSGGGTTNFLRADGTWAAPSGGGGSPSLATTILADSPFAFWKCNDASTSFADSSGNGFNLTTLNGTVTFQQSPMVGSDPSSQFAVMGTFGGNVAGNNNLQLTSQLGQTYPLTNFTVECMVFFCSGSSNSFRLLDLRPTGGANAVFLLFATTNALSFYIAATAVMTTTYTAYVPGRPIHVMVTVSTTGGTSTYKMYFNGTMVATATGTAGVTSGSNMVMTIGGWGGNTSLPFLIGYTALYNTALSPARVAAHAQAAGLLGT